MIDAKLVKHASDLRACSTCLKQKNAALVIKNGKVLSEGFNLCAPHGTKYGEEVHVCPRMNLKSGTGYELCGPIHAEVMAPLNIRKNRDPEEVAQFASHLPFTPEQILSAFTSDEKKKLKGATLFLAGHYWACEGCMRFINTLGMKIEIEQSAAEETKNRYIKGNIT
jgi:hypothetical protein